MAETKPNVDPSQTLEELADDPSQQELARDVADAATPDDRGAIINIFLVLLFAGGLACFAVLYLEFWLLDFSVLRDPAPVWAQCMWFMPELVVCVIAFFVLVSGVKTNPLKAPSVHMVVMAFVALIFSTIGAVHYQGLFWQCEEKIGSMEEIETHICNHNRTQLRTIAWIAVLFVAHALSAIGIGVATYSSDAGQFQNSMRYLSSGYKGAKKQYRKARGKGYEDVNPDVDSRYPQRNVNIGVGASKLNRRNAGRSPLSDWRSSGQV